MPFPFSIRGSIPIPVSLSDRAIILACVDQIEQEGARVVWRSDRSTEFTSPLFRRLGSNWRFTVPLSGGSFEITGEPTGARRLSYDLSTRRVALIGTAMFVGLFVVAFIVGRVPFPLPIAAGFWLWIVGANYIISYMRAPSWVRRRLSDAARAQSLDPVVQPFRL